MAQAGVRRGQERIGAACRGAQPAARNAARGRGRNESFPQGGMGGQACGQGPYGVDSPCAGQAPVAPLCPRRPAPRGPSDAKQGGVKAAGIGLEAPFVLVWKSVSGFFRFHPIRRHIHIACYGATLVSCCDDAGRQILRTYLISILADNHLLGKITEPSAPIIISRAPRTVTTCPALQFPTMVRKMTSLVTCPACP